tara:strand:- start:43 stop:210 length:168 start_codon:yes stop_codon:yes gene_type:complete
MSVTNDELIEEILWKAYAKGLGKDVIDRAKSHMDSGMRKSFAFQQAYEDLQVDYH